MANRHGGIYRWNESTYNPITGTTKGANAQIELYIEIYIL